jgi:hypothetical protein
MRSKLILLGCIVGLAFAHQHDSVLNLKQAFKAKKHKGLEAMQGKIVDESHILMEEILASAQGRKELFDSDVPNTKDTKEEKPDARYKRQVGQEDIRHALCQDKNAGEFFRLVAGTKQCRDVVSCADGGLQAIRCPPGLAFDLSKQTCEWRQLVKDCNIKARPKLALPNFNTDEPICEPGELSCGDGQCLPRLVVFVNYLLKYFYFLGLCFVMTRLTVLTVVMRICVIAEMIQTGRMIVIQDSAGGND